MLKINLQLLLLCLICSTPATAQEKKIDFGVKAGGNYSMYSSYMNSFNAYAGVFGQYKFNEKVYLQSELIFSATDDIYFIEFPVLAKYKLSNTLYAFAGPKLTYLLNDEKKYNESYDLNDNYTFKKLGIAAEVGIQHYLFPHIFIEGRFGFNFTNQVNEFYYDQTDEFYYEENNHFHIHTVKAGIGYVF